MTQRTWPPASPRGACAFRCAATQCSVPPVILHSSVPCFAQASEFPDAPYPEGGYFPGTVTRCVDKFANAWVKFPNEKQEHWWPVKVVLPWMSPGAAFSAMPAAIAAMAAASAASAAKPATVQITEPFTPVVSALDNEPLPQNARQAI